MPDNNLIFDFGFHNGDDTDFYLAKGFRVVAVEADPNLVQKGIARFESHINNNQLAIVNKAVSDTVGVQHFYIHPVKSDWSSCFKELAESDGSKAQVVTVETTSLADLCKLYGVPRYLKVDIEGCDLMVPGRFLISKKSLHLFLLRLTRETTREYLHTCMFRAMRAIS
jgi:FkbM family methyltransferase